MAVIVKQRSIFLSESSPLPLLLFETARWVTLSCRIDGQDGSDSNDPAITPHFGESIPNCVTRAIQSLFEKRYGFFSIMPAPFQCLENTRHEKGFAVFGRCFSVSWFRVASLLLSAFGYAEPKQDSAFSDTRARKDFCLERHDIVTACGRHRKTRTGTFQKCQSPVEEHSLASTGNNHVVAMLVAS